MWCLFAFNYCSALPFILPFPLSQNCLLHGHSVQPVPGQYNKALVSCERKLHVNKMDIAV